MRLYKKRWRRRRKALILSMATASALGLILLPAMCGKLRYGSSGRPAEPSGTAVTALCPVKIRPRDAPAPAEARSLYPEFSYSRDWDADESYLLAKIAMAEAEGEPVRGKALVILVVLNRVYDGAFPGTIQDVLFEPGQFSPVASGRFSSVEPDESCWEAVYEVMGAQYDYSRGALYFESCGGDSWHSRNLEFLYQYGNHKFYK